MIFATPLHKFRQKKFIMKTKTFLFGSVLVINCLFPFMPCAAETFKINPQKSSLGFSIKHLGINNVQGSFKDLSGIIDYNEKDPSKSSVNVIIKAASIDTKNGKRDEHLRNAEFFDVKKYPEITFKSKQVIKTAAGYLCKGDLSMHGVSKEVSIPFDLSVQGKQLISKGQTVINRKNFAINYDNSGLLIGNDIKVSLSVKALKE